MNTAYRAAKNPSCRIGLVQVRDDGIWVGQHDQVLREEADGVDLVLRFREPHRPRFGNAKQFPHGADVALCPRPSSVRSLIAVMLGRAVR
jgi:hypothetical protein